MILCIDPGARNAGVALFENYGLLTTAWLSSNGDWKGTADDIVDRLPISAVCISTVVIEKMQIYDNTPLAHANACITLSLMAGRFTGLFKNAAVVEYLPRQWKGQVPKSISTKRTQNALSKGETSRVDLPSAKLAHNVWDAIGIGLHHTRKERAENGHKDRQGGSST